jgi:hypothetical protein
MKRLESLVQLLLCLQGRRNRVRLIQVVSVFRRLVSLFLRSVACRLCESECEGRARAKENSPQYLSRSVVVSESICELLFVQSGHGRW